MKSGSNVVDQFASFPPVVSFGEILIVTIWLHCAYVEGSQALDIETPAGAICLIHDPTSAVKLHELCLVIVG